MKFRLQILALSTFFASTLTALSQNPLNHKGPIFQSPWWKIDGPVTWRGPEKTFTFVEVLPPNFGRPAKTHALIDEDSFLTSFILFQKSFSDLVKNTGGSTGPLSHGKYNPEGTEVMPTWTKIKNTLRIQLKLLVSHLENEAKVAHDPEIKKEYERQLKEAQEALRISRKDEITNRDFNDLGTFFSTTFKNSLHSRYYRVSIDGEEKIKKLGDFDVFTKMANWNTNISLPLYATRDGSSPYVTGDLSAEELAESLLPPVTIGGKRIGQKPGHRIKE